MTIKLLLTTSAILIDPCLAQPSSEQPLPAAYENKYVEPQPGNMQSMRDFGIPSPRTSPSNPSLQGPGNSVKEETERV